MLAVDADWDAVAAAITTRMDELKMAQKTLAERSKVSQATIRQLQRNHRPRERNPRTLEALSVTLSWPANYLAQVAGGEDAHPLKVDTALHGEVAQLRSEVATLHERVDALERSSVSHQHHH